VDPYVLLSDKKGSDLVYSSNLIWCVFKKKKFLLILFLFIRLFLCVKFLYIRIIILSFLLL
jgi:hypothetical protein